jgi:hypothetical protein
MSGPGMAGSTVISARVISVSPATPGNRNQPATVILMHWCAGPGPASLRCGPARLMGSTKKLISYPQRMSIIGAS